MSEVPEQELLNLEFDKEEFELPDEIERIPSDQLSYHDFFWKYMKPNKPVIITAVSNDWSCSKQWTSSERVDFSYLLSVVGNQTVPVANCSKVYFNSHEKSEIPLEDYIQYWQNRNESSDIMYLKDWHLKAATPDYDFYKVPKYFASDWLNEYLIDTGKDDYRFVYIGPKGSWTPFHSDVFSSFSWSTNIFGIKKWLLLPQGEEQKLKEPLGNDPFSIDEDMLEAKSVRYFTVMQQSNEALFVPSKWYHQVWNLTDTISVNHNWYNGCNIQTIWKSLVSNLESVIDEISDCKDMEDFDSHCQVMLKSIFGMNCAEFVDILEHIAKKRLSNMDNVSFETYKLNFYHSEFDLQQLFCILCDIVEENIVCKLDEIQSRCMQLLEKIKKPRNKMMIL